MASVVDGHYQDNKTQSMERTKLTTHQSQRKLISQQQNTQHRKQPEKAAAYCYNLHTSLKSITYKWILFTVKICFCLEDMTLL